MSYMASISYFLINFKPTLMEIKRIESYKFIAESYRKGEEGLVQEINNYFDNISDSELEIATFILNKEGTNKNKFLFNRVSLSQKLKEYLKQGKYILLYLLIVVIIGVVINYLVSNNIVGEGIGFVMVAIIVVFIISLLGYLMKLISFSKELIIRNGYMLEKTILNSTKNNYSFDEIVNYSYKNYTIFYFKRKGSLIEKSIIIYNDCVEANAKLEEFFNKYVSITQDIKPAKI
jgi:hypothetical protein